MTAGKGIVHCEMPYGDTTSHGLQLWVNLAKKFKMVDPAYQELLSKDIPLVKKDGVQVKVIAGESMGVKVQLSFSARCQVILAVMSVLLLCHCVRATPLFHYICYQVIPCFFLICKFLATKICSCWICTNLVALRGKLTMHLFPLFRVTYA